MKEWRCSHCFRAYTFEEMLELPKVQAIVDEADPMAMDGHGYHPACEYGKEFHKGKWQLRQEIGKYLVSTVHLELDHSFYRGPPIWYETMIFGLPHEPQWRYHTQEDAIKRLTYNTCNFLRGC